MLMTQASLCVGGGNTAESRPCKGLGEEGNMVRAKSPWYGSVQESRKEGGDKKTGPHTRTGGGKKKKIRAQLLKSSLTFPLICGTESKEKKRSRVALLGHRQLDSFHPGPTQTLGPRAVLGERFSFSGTSRLCRLTHSDLCPIC